MGDKSPKSKQKNKTQKNSKETASDQEKQRQVISKQQIKAGAAAKKK